MLKKTIKYVDYDNNVREEDFYFNLNKAELVEMEMGVSGGLEKKLRKVVASQDGAEIMAIFKDIITRAYGEKSDDGKRFIKSKEIADNFLQTEAYSELFMELTTDPDKASSFIKGILPSGLMEESEKAQGFNKVEAIQDAMKKLDNKEATDNVVTTNAKTIN